MAPHSSSSHSGPRYNIARNPPYQINYRAKRAGKHITASKRRITFQFGFSNARAIASGLTGGECRGEEHEIVLIWSHASGKRVLYMNGREVHMSKAARGNTRFEYAWNAWGGHTLKIIANGTPQSKSSYQRQFDLELDGMSFFEFSRIYELGSGSGSGSGRRESKRDSYANDNADNYAYSYRGAAFESRDDEEYEDEEELPMTEVSTAIDLFDDSQQQSSLVSPVSMTNYSSVPSLIGSTGSGSTSSYDEFAPVPVQYTQPKKSFSSVSSEILCAYNNPPPPPQSNTPSTSNSRALVPMSEEGMDPVAKSMKNLVNLDDITTKPIQPINPNSPSLATMKKGQANWGLVGRAPTLSEMHASTAQSATVSTREPMKMHPPAQQYYQAQQPQTMVAYQGYQGANPAYAGHYGAPNMGYAPAY